MISISRLWCDAPEAGDTIRYRRSSDGGGLCRVVVCNITRRCDLHCRHCYAGADGCAAADELGTTELIAVIDDLAASGVQALLLSGGEPLLRPDLVDLVRHAVTRGLRTVLSTNGMSLDQAMAGRLAEAGMFYAGVSVDGIRATHDAFRARPGAFDRAIQALRACRAVGLKAGVRFTITRGNQVELPAVLDLAIDEGVPRICVYHLAYAGRGSRLAFEDQDHAGRRSSLDYLIDRTAALHAAGRSMEVLTVDNHADGPYLLLRRLRDGDAEGARRIAELLGRGGGNASGERIGCISWDGTVYPDQFWRTAPLGSVRERPFSAIWRDPAISLLARLRERRCHLRGRCPNCRFYDYCKGNLRCRAAAAGDVWGDDPACYLSDVEIQEVEEKRCMKEGEEA